MSDALVLAVALFFLAMGIAALLQPARVLAIFGTVVEARDTRNEIRAVYGGFGVAVAGLLVYATQRADLRSGIVAAIAIGVAGMAAGRLWSATIDRGAGFYPWFFFAVELALAAALAISLRGSIG